MTNPGKHLSRGAMRSYGSEGIGLWHMHGLHPVIGRLLWACSAGEGVPVRSWIGAAYEREDQRIDQFWMLDREGVRAR
jgi:hypothetical protein